MSRSVLGESPRPPWFVEAMRLERLRTYEPEQYLNGHQYPAREDLVFLEPGAVEPSTPLQFTDNGLVQTFDGGFAVRLGPSSRNEMYFSVRIITGPPGLEETHGTEVVDVSWTAQAGDATTPGLEGSLPPAPGAYRLRVAVSGRDRRRPTCEITIWPAPIEQPLVHRVRDHVGAALRGESAPPVDPDREKYHWVRDTDLHEAATVTVVPRNTVDGLLTVLPDPVPVSLTDTVASWELDRRVVLGELDGAVLMLEFNGFEGSIPSLLARLSESGRAGSVYWGVNNSETLSLAENGTYLAREEMLGDPVHWDPLVRELSRGVDPDDLGGQGAFAFVALERFTGVPVTAQDVERVCASGRAFAIGESDWEAG